MISIHSFSNNNFRSLVLIADLLLLADQIKPIDCAEIKCDPVHTRECVISGAIIVDSDKDFQIIDITGGDVIHKLEFISPASRLTILPQAIFNHFPNLQELQLNSVGITALSPDRFENASSLLNLHLRNNLLHVLQSKLFAKATKLEVIDLANNRIETIEDNAFNDLEFLQWLDLSNNSISSIQPKAFCGAISLSFLALGSNQIATIGATALDLLNLKELYLEQNRLKKLPSDIFSKLSHVREIILEGNELTHIGDLFKNCTDLHTLGLGNNPIVDLKLIEFSTHLSLAYLSLENTGINVTAHAPIEAQCNNSNVVYLNLSSNNLSDPDIFKWLTIFGKLEELQLVNNHFTHFNHLADLKTWFPALNYLPVIDNKFLCHYIIEHAADFRNMKIKAIVNYDETDEKCHG